MSPEVQTLLSILIAAIGVLVSYIVAKQQTDLQKRLHTIERKSALRAELAIYMALLDRGLFDAGILKEDPVEMLKAIKELKSRLRTSGAINIPDQISKQQFEIIKQALTNKETEVEGAFPYIKPMVSRSEYTWEDKQHVRNEMKNDYFTAISSMMELRLTLTVPFQTLKKRLDDLTTPIDVTL